MSVGDAEVVVVSCREGASVGDAEGVPVCNTYRA